MANPFTNGRPKIMHNKYDIRVTPVMEFNNRGLTGGNKYELPVFHKNFHYDITKYSFTAQVINIWNSLPNYIVDIDSINILKSRLDKFCLINQIYLTGKQICLLQYKISC